MTVDEIRAVVRLATMVDSGEISDAQLLLWINESIYDVAMRDDWDWLEAETTFATVAATQAYAITSMTSGDEMQSIEFVIRDGQQRPLIPIAHSQAMALWGDNVTSGTPKYFSIYKESVYLFPIPDAVETINVHYIKPPSELSAAADTPAWIGTFHNLVVPYVIAQVWKQQEDYAKAQMSMAEYFDRLDMMKRAYQARQNTGPWTLGAGRSTRTGVAEPFRNDWSDADV